MAAQILPDLLAPGLRVVFVGTAAGATSAARGAYYAGPGNRFWRILAETGLTPIELTSVDYADLIDHGIGLTDLAKHVAGADADLRTGSFDVAGFVARIRDFSPRTVAFNGIRAARIFLGRPSGPCPYGALPEVPGLPTMHVLPSTSGAANGAWDVRPWCDLACELNAGG